jgi:hypothetical protein
MGLITVFRLKTFSNNNVDKAQPIANLQNMSRKHSKHIRKPMPPPTVAHDLLVERQDNAYANEQVKEAIQQWHADPADEHGWDWPHPSEAGPMTKIQ